MKKTLIFCIFPIDTPRIASRIMSVAHAMAKKYNVSMSVSIRYAWNLTKAENKAQSRHDDYCGKAKTIVNVWEKEEISRTYIEVRHYTAAWNLKHVTKIGYIDNRTGYMVTT